VQEVAEEFGGEDPLQPDVQALFDGCLGSCTELRDEIADHGEIELPEPADELRAMVQHVIDHEVAHVPTR
jgi:hypothetical protein